MGQNPGASPLLKLTHRLSAFVDHLVSTMEINKLAGSLIINEAGKKGNLPIDSLPPS